MSCGKNTFSDISKCQNLPLDNAFQNKKGGGGVAQKAIKVLNEKREPKIFVSVIFSSSDIEER